MDMIQEYINYAVALALGFLVGFQREFSFNEKEKEHAAGVRTFSLLAIMGAIAADFSMRMQTPWIFGIAILVVAVLLGLNYHHESRKSPSGLTTEVVAILVMFIGALSVIGELRLAVFLGIIITIVLSAKQELHGFAGRITKGDLNASLKFAVISAIVLPLMPNQVWGDSPWNILNPFKIWLLVVFISGISFIGFILMKWLGAARGIGLTGLIGGLASSTALTLSFTQRSKDRAELSPSYAMAILLSWAVMFVRVLIEVAVVYPPLVPKVMPALLVMGAVAALFAWILYKKRQQKETLRRGMQLANPFELLPAIKFGLLFTVMLVLVKVAQAGLGDAGIYISSFLSGLADADAMVLSAAELISQGVMDLDLARDAVILALLANTLSKGVMVIFLGTKELRRAIIPAYIVLLVSGAAVIFFCHCG
jgi:uncharacterized membrane protein (DUF4010 family)